MLAREKKGSMLDDIDTTDTMSLFMSRNYGVTRTDTGKNENRLFVSCCP
jgi:hypothetical protein